MVVEPHLELAERVFWASDLFRKTSGAHHSKDKDIEHTQTNVRSDFQQGNSREGAGGEDIVGAALQRREFDGVHCALCSGHFEVYSLYSVYTKKEKNV
jgi:hypothetical protein